MSYMFEVYCNAPTDSETEAAINFAVTPLGGRLDYREAHGLTAGCICLTYEFDTWEQAELAAQAIRKLGKHVEGPVPYGD